MPSPSQVAREVVQGLNGVPEQQQNNPLAEMFNALKQQLMSQIMEEMKARLNIPIKVTPKSNSFSDGNAQAKGKAVNEDDIFVGDVDEEEEK
jgi:hypothetical protein